MLTVGLTLIIVLLLAIGLYIDYIAFWKKQENTECPYCHKINNRLDSGVYRCDVCESFFLVDKQGEGHPIQNNFWHIIIYGIISSIAIFIFNFLFEKKGLEISLLFSVALLLLFVVISLFERRKYKKIMRRINGTEI